LALAEHEIEIENARREYGEILEELQTLRAELERDSLGRLPVPLVLRDVLRVRGTAPSAEPILFEARTNRAGWSVRYDINLNSETGDIDAVMFAMVNQGTGLDLDGSFSFHSRAPSLAVTAPRLNPLTVSLAERVQRIEQRSTGEPTLFGGLSFNMNPSTNIDFGIHSAFSPEMIVQRRDITSTLANVSIAGSGRIKGDGVVTSVELGQFEFPSTPLLIAIPEQNREAWIVARLDAVPDAFLPGPAALYIDGVTSGRTNIPEMGLQETLPFGMAQRVTVEKRRSAGVTGTTWFGRTGTLQNGFTIEVTNNMDTEHEVEVRDRLPMPADDRITLENIRINPAPELQDDENRLTWRITLQPGETGRISVEYTLRYPEDETLVYR